MNRAIFLDRDGVINIDHGYTHTIEQFQWIPGVKEACRQLVGMGFQLIVVTNQSGIARGMYSIAEFQQLTQWMQSEFAHSGAPIQAVYFCPHHPMAGNGEYTKVCDCRKPAPGLILRAASEHNIQLGSSWFVGDKESDMKAAYNAGAANRVLVRTGKPVSEQPNSAATVVLESLAQLPAYINKKQP